MSGDLTAQLLQDTLALFSRAFPSQPAQSASSLVVASAPGRVNLIGEHTDYNDGFVMPMAIERRTVVLGRANGSSPPLYRVVSQNISDEKDAHGHHVAVAPNASNFSIVSLSPQQLVALPTAPAWHDYLRGVVAQYVKEGRSIPAFDVAVAGNVPLGGGLSSSASLEVATATFIDGLLGIQTDGVKKALMCQKAEHDYANVPCGIMDQFVSSLGQEKAAMLLDCRTQTPKLVSFVDPAVAILITSQLRAAVCAARHSPLPDAAAQSVSRSAVVLRVLRLQREARAGLRRVREASRSV